MSLLKQHGPEIRPYKIWIQLPDGTWTIKEDVAPRTQEVEHTQIVCVANCNYKKGTFPIRKPVYEKRTTTKTETYTPEGKTITIQIGGAGLLDMFLRGGLGGADNPIISYFPPITTEVNCEDYAPLKFKGGKESTDYIITMEASGNVIDTQTKDIITTFNVERSIECPGPIAGYAINQYALQTIGRRDLSIHGYYFKSLQEEGNNIKSVDKPFNLSLKEASGDMTIIGEHYEFQLTNTELVSLVKKNGEPEINNSLTIGPPSCRIIIKDAIGVLLDVVVFGEPDIYIEDPWGNTTVN